MHTYRWFIKILDSTLRCICYQTFFFILGADWNQFNQACLLRSRGNMQRRALFSFPGWIIFVVVFIVIVFFCYCWCSYRCFYCCYCCCVVVVVVVVVVANRPIVIISRRQPGSSSANGLLLWQVLWEQWATTCPTICIRKIREDCVAKIFYGKFCKYQHAYTR